MKERRMVVAKGCREKVMGKYHLISTEFQSCKRDGGDGRTTA